MFLRSVSISKTKKRILCVEDHPDTCELISTILKKYDCTSAYSKADALSLATKEKFTPGDITLARARIELYKFSNTTTTPNYIFGNLAVNASGDVETTL